MKKMPRLRITSHVPEWKNLWTPSNSPLLLLSLVAPRTVIAAAFRLCSPQQTQDPRTPAAQSRRTRRRSAVGHTGTSYAVRSDEEVGQKVQRPRHAYVAPRASELQRSTPRRDALGNGPDPG